MFKKLMVMILLANSFYAQGINYFKEWFPSKISLKRSFQKVVVPEEIKPTVAEVAVLYLEEKPDFKQIHSKLVQAAKSKNIKGILLLVDNTGGHTSTYSSLHDLIVRIKRKKPIVALIVGHAFSGGYKVASAADYIVSGEANELGSIGAAFELTRIHDIKRIAEIEGAIKKEVISAGEYKTMAHHYEKECAEHHRDYLQKHVEKVYQQFVTSVAQNRALSKENYREWAEGKIFLGWEALTLGLIDEIGTIFEAEAKMLELIRARNLEVSFEDEIKQVIL